MYTDTVYIDHKVVLQYVHIGIDIFTYKWAHFISALQGAERCLHTGLGQLYCQCPWPHAGTSLPNTQLLEPRSATGDCFHLAISQDSQPQRKARPEIQRTQKCLIPFSDGTAGCVWLSTLRSTTSCGHGVTPRSLAQCQVPEHPRKSCSPQETALPMAQTRGDLGCRGRREVASRSLCTQGPQPSRLFRAARGPQARSRAGLQSRALCVRVRLLPSAQCGRSDRCDIT